jgi:hypothetical protein
MSFQAPFNPIDLASMHMKADYARQAGQQQTMAGISGAIDNLMGAYMERESRIAKGKAMKNAFGVIAPSLGMDEATLQQFTGELKNPMDWYNFGETVGPFLPSAISASSIRNRVGAQQAAPAFRAQANAASQVAAGQGRMTAPPSNINFGVIP